MRVLGLSAFHRDSAAVLVVDGRPVAGARESWFTRKRSDPAFPRRAARECLRRAGLRADELDAVVFARKPLLEFERVLVTLLRDFPRSARGFSRGMFLWLGDRLWLRNRIASELGLAHERVRFAEHHRALAAAAFRRSGFDQAAVLTLDDGGEWSTTTLGRADAAGVEPLGELHLPDSLALFGAAVAQLVGLDPLEGGALLEGLGAGADPRFRLALAALVPDAADGSFQVQPDALRLAGDGGALYGPALERALGPAREPGACPGEREAEIAASYQALLEERVLGVARELARRTRLGRLCFTGSAAANRRLVARLGEAGPFDELYVPPCPDEAEAALGAALLQEAAPDGLEAEGFLGGPPLPDPEAAAARALDAGEEIEELARRLAQDQCVAWVRGARELGPASLGRRGALRAADGTDAARELLGALRLDEPGREPELLLPARLAGALLEPCGAADAALRFGRVAPYARAELQRVAPAAVRPDGRVPARVVEAERDPELHALLDAVERRGRPPLLLHVTLALRGAPPVCGETDALDAFRRSALAALVVENRCYEAR